MKTHYCLLGHGSVEKTPTEQVLMKRVNLVIYTPPKAALAGNVADQLYECYMSKGKQGQRIRMWTEGWLSLVKTKLVLRPRISKGASVWMHENIMEEPGEYPKTITYGQLYPNLTLSGGKKIKYSGVYEITKCEGIYPQENSKKLTSGKKLDLSEILHHIQDPGEGHTVWVHWLACLSDHTPEDEIWETGTELGNLMKMEWNEKLY